MLLYVNFENFFKLKLLRGKINISWTVNNQWQSPVRTHQRAKWFLQWSTNWKKVRTICCQVQLLMYQMFLNWMSHIKCFCIKRFWIKCFCIKCQMLLNKIENENSNITLMLAGRCLLNGKEPSDVKWSQPGKKITVYSQNIWSSEVN
jgi:hypothetical protein